MGTDTQKEENKYEAIGKTIFGISYFIYATKFILIASAVAFVILWFFGKPLWLSPLFGLGIFLVYRALYRTIFRLLYNLSKD